MAETSRLPLAGMRVLDFGNVLSVPYAGGLMTDLGAEVIKIEAPHRTDVTRGFGEFMQDDPGSDAWNKRALFQVVNRGKKSLIVDMTKPEGQELFRKLVAVSDMVIENFTPRVLPSWGMGYENLKKINPRLIMLSNCGYGSTGPWGPLPIQGTSLEATNGIIRYTGYPDAAQKAGQSYPDFLACWTGMLSVFLALEHLRQTGEGQWIDQSMYQIGVSLIPEPLLQYELDGSDWERVGNRDRWKAPSNVYRSKGDDKWIGISVDSDAKWRSMLALMNRPDLLEDQRFTTILSRRQNVEELDQIVGAWTAEQDAFELMERLQAEGIAAMPVFETEDVHFNKQFLHREFLEPMSYGEEVGTRPLFGRPYKMRNTPIKIRSRAPDFGHDNQYVLREVLGLDDKAIEELYSATIVSDVPVNAPGATAIAGFGSTGKPEDQAHRDMIEQHWGKAKASS